MLVPNRRIDVGALASMLEEQYGVAGARPRFLPIGADSWCYRAGPLWVSCRRDIEGHFAAAYEAALELHHRGCEFVVPPLAGRDGAVVHSVSGCPVVVAELLCARPVEAGPPATRAELDEIVGIVHRLHGMGVAAPIPVEDYRFVFTAQLASTLATAGGGMTGSGPYAERLYLAIARTAPALHRLVDELEALAGRCAAAAGALVVSHGDVAAGNVLRHRGRLLLADWSGTMWAPPERDWFHLRRSFGLPARGRPELLRFYELRWALNEIAEYASHFLDPHEGTVEDEAMWRELQRYLP